MHTERGDDMKARIALIYGGAGSEHDVSVMGYRYVTELLKNSDYEILPVYVDEAGDWFVRIKGADTPAFPTRNMRGSLYTGYGFIKIDVAIPLLHGDGGEDGSVQGALEVSGIPYVGAGVCASAVCLDKVLAKTVADSLSIPTVEGVSFTRATDTEAALVACLEKLSFPMFIKPRRLGSSVGAYPARDEDEFKRSFQNAMRDGGNLVLVERMLLDKRELECAFCEMRGERVITPPGEILIDGFYGYGEKYGGKTHTVAIADVHDEVREQILTYSAALVDALGLRHLARIDYFQSDGRIYFNEVNTFPGFTGESLYPRMLKASGIDPALALISFVEDALGC